MTDDPLHRPNDGARLQQDPAGGPMPMPMPMPVPSVLSAAPVPPAPTGRHSLIHRVLTEQAGPSALIAGVALAGALAVAIVIMLIGSFAVPQGVLDVWGLAKVPMHLVGVALGGVVTIVSSLHGNETSVSLAWLPVGITGALTLFLIVGGAVVEHLRPTTVALRWIASGITGLALSTGLLLCTVVVPPITLTVQGYPMTVSAAPPATWLGALVIGTLASRLGRAIVVGRKTGRALEQRGGPVAWAFWSALGAASVYTTLGVLTAGTAGVVIAAMGAPSSAFAGLLWGPTAGFAGLGLLSLSHLRFSGTGSASAVLEYREPLSLFGLPPWLVLIALAAGFVLILLAALVLRLRRPTAAARAVSWVITAGVFGAVGVLTTIVGGATAWMQSGTPGIDVMGGLSDSVGQGSVTMRLAPWTCLLFAVVGLLVEAMARFVAPTIIRVVPVRVAGWLSGVGRPKRIGVIPQPDPASVSPSSVSAPGVSPVPSGAPVGPPAPQGGPHLGQPAGSVPVVPRQPMSPERRKTVRRSLIIGGSALVLVIGGSVAAAVVSDHFSPERQVRNYLDAVIAGRATEALQIADTSARTADRVLLTDVVLAATSGIDSYRIESVSTEGDETVVNAELDQDGLKTRVSYQLMAEGAAGGLFPVWRVQGAQLPTVRLVLPEGLDDVVVNGQSVDLSGVERREYGEMDLPVFPGEYTFAMPDDSEWASGTSKTVLITDPNGTSGRNAVLELRPTDALVAEVQAAVDELLARCVGSTSLKPENCPFSAYSFLSDATDVRWAITEQPTLDVTYEWAFGEFRFTSPTFGKARVTYNSSDRYSGGVQTRDATIFIGGKITFEDGAPVITFDTTYW